MAARDYKHITFGKRDLKREWPRELLLAYSEGFRGAPKEFIEKTRLILWLGTPWLVYQDAFWAASIPQLVYPDARLQGIVSEAYFLATQLDTQTGRRPWYVSGLTYKITREFSPALYVKCRDQKYSKMLVQRVKRFDPAPDEIDMKPAGRYTIGEKETPPGFLDLPATRFWWD